MRGLVSKLLPSKNADSQAVDVAPRLSPYAEQFAYAPAVGKYPFADEGSYFRSGTPTPGTGVSFTVSASFSDTVPFVLLNNVGSKTIWLDYFRFIVTVVPASATTAQFAVKTDVVPRAYTTAHGIQATTQNMNPGSGVTSGAQVFYQNNSTASAIPAASSQAVIIGEASLNGLPIVQDEYVIEFGQRQLSGNAGLTAVQATEPTRKATSMGPCVVPPGGSAVIHAWFASNAITALSYSFELGHVER